ncbi:Predicted dienelactone hydrolase [Chlamydia abortus]|uniref:alpha/beta hydrolase family protein n=1 Tax=Paenibacillus sp. SAFN-117 TaxID=3436860 RepID=UPI000A27E1AA|nr:Predicted dienelactone hydrolase [Chlamydia abortus]
MNRIQELEQYKCTLYDTRDQLKLHIFDRADRAFAAGDHDRDSIVDIAGLQARQAAIREAFLTVIGGLPPSDAPLNARTTGKTQAVGYSVENVIFEPRPGHYVTANFYLPDEREERCAAVLFLCGHEYEAKHSPYYHQVCLRFVQAGFSVLAIDPIGQGERLAFVDFPAGEPIWGTQEHQLFGAQCYPLGDSIARYFVHDAMRAVDYLQQRPEIDATRIGVTGNSGGGTQTAMLMVCDERLAVAAPATFIMNRRQYMHAGGVQDAEQVWPGLSAQGFDHEDLLLAFAPKPLLVLAVQYDFFPIEATRRTVDRCRRFWEMSGKAGELLLIEDQSTHRYTDRLAVAAARFFSWHLAGRGAKPFPDTLAAPEPEPLSPVPAERLLCTASGQVRRDWPAARTVRDENAARCERLRRMRAGLAPESRRVRALGWLRERVCGPRTCCELNPRRIGVGEADGLRVEYLLWWSQRDLMNSGYLFHADGTDGADCRVAERYRPVTVALWPGGTSRLSRHWPWIRQTCAQGRDVLVLNVSGVGPHEPHAIYGKPAHRFFGVMHKLTDDLLWLGDSLAALRTYDTIRCLDVLAHLGEWPDEPADFYTDGRYGMYVQLAAMLDKRIGRITGRDLLGSISDWVEMLHYEEEDVMSLVFPGILQYLDLGELARKEGYR